MTLKKDTMVAVSLAGVVLILAIGSTKVGSGNSSYPSTSASRVSHNPTLYKAYLDFMNSREDWKSDGIDLRHRAARKVARELYDRGQLGTPIDLVRASTILASSTDPSELSLSHELAADALSRGVKSARKIVLEAEDRLLLSAGRPQRYGTQRSWMGQPLPGGPFPAESELTPKEQNILKTGSRAIPPFTD